MRRCTSGWKQKQEEDRRHPHMTLLEQAGLCYCGQRISGSPSPEVQKCMCSSLESTPGFGLTLGLHHCALSPALSSYIKQLLHFLAHQHADGHCGTIVSDHVCQLNKSLCVCVCVCVISLLNKSHAAHE